MDRYDPYTDKFLRDTQCDILGTNLAEVGTDCISRQAAIDALRAAYWDKNIQSAKDDPCIVDAMTDWAIRQIKGLPSAPLYTEDELQAMQDLEWSQMEKMYELGKEEHKKGKWEWCGNHHLCSECDEWALTVWDDNEYEEVDVLTNFCPNCGADIREGVEDEN